MLQDVNLKIAGVAPLLHHKATLVDPTHPLTKQLKAITSKRKKTEEDHEEIARIEWYAALYHDEDIGPYIPAEYIEQCFIEAGRITKAGKDVQRAFLVTDEKIPLIYRGERRDLEKMRLNGFRDLRPVRIQRASTIRCRPIFRQWELEVAGKLDTSILDLDIFREIVERAGVSQGLGDYRPRFGRFTVEVR